MSSIILAMIRKNVPLYTWRTWVDNGGEGLGFYSGGKNQDKVVRAIFNSMSHPDAVALIAQDYVNLPDGIRLGLRDLCNSSNSATGNVRKGVERCNKLLNGALLRAPAQSRSVMVRTESTNGAGRRNVVVNPAIAGATRKYGVLTGPLSRTTR
jgi:hypothetical protein